MVKRRYAGRRLVFWGSLGLILASGFDFCIRFDMLWWTLSGLYNLCTAEGIPFFRALSYFDADMLRRLSLLFNTAGLGVFSLLLRNRPRAGFALIPLAIALGVYSFFQTGFILPAIPGVAHLLQWVPMAVIVVGCSINLGQFYAQRRKERLENENRPARQPGEFRRAPLSTYSGHHGAEQDQVQA